MGNGLTVSQSGIAVTQALDAQKVRDSRWRYLTIAHEREITLPQIVDSPGPRVKVFSHKLNFVPAFDCWSDVIGDYVEGSVPGNEDNINGLFADSENIYFRDYFGTQNVALSNTSAFLRVYNVPIAEEYAAPIENTFPVSSTTDSKHGVKIVDPPSSMQGHELSKYGLNTQSKTLAIQKTGVVVSDASTDFVAVINHGVGNPPIYLATSISRDRSIVAALNPNFVPVLAQATKETLTFQGAQAVLLGSFAYIIFKELADFTI